MIIVRAPVRIPIGGGGTDWPSYYLQYGGGWASAAIDKYIYVTINKRFEKPIRISYSKTEEVSNVDEIQHPIVREALKLVGITSNIEIISIADVPSGTGLGSSGAFTVALLTALYAYLKRTTNAIIPSSRKKIAEQACHIAMHLLKEPSGKQDEYIAAYGGMISCYADRNGNVSVTPLFPSRITPETAKKLEDNLLMFYTGIRRDSRDILQEHSDAVWKKEPVITETLHRTGAICKEIIEALSQSDFHQFADLVNAHWQERLKRKGDSTPQIDKWYNIARENGALGGKLVGAGGGGFLLFYCEDKKEQLRKAMAGQGLKEQPFRFEIEGVKIIAS